jgi:hypothetical protein
MEDKNIKKLHIVGNLPEVKRTVDGKIDLEAIKLGEDEKGRVIIPDEIIEAYYKELPDGVTNPNNDKWVYNAGLLKKADREVQKMGAEALNAKNAQRRKLSETIDIFLKKKASIEEIEQLGLEEGATKQDALIAAMFTRAIEQKDVAAFTSLRDTAGEKPTDKIAAEVETITAEDRERIERILNRDKTAD